MVSESPTMVMYSSVAGRDQTSIGRDQVTMVKEHSAPEGQIP